MYFGSPTAEPNPQPPPLLLQRPVSPQRPAKSSAHATGEGGHEGAWAGEGVCVDGPFTRSEMVLPHSLAEGDPVLLS